MIDMPSTDKSVQFPESDTLFDNSMMQIDVGRTLRDHVPNFAKLPYVLQRLCLWMLRKVIFEVRINRFLADYGHLHNFDFIDHIFEELRFAYQIRHSDIQNIPMTGRAIIIANHPLGALDGLALLQLIGSVRRDVKIIANDILMQVSPLSGLMLPVDNLSGETRRRDISRIYDALKRDEAVIVFPAGEVSRAGANGIRDSKWSAGFLRLSEQAQAPLLPVRIRARNSSFFYMCSRLNKAFSMLLLPSEMFRFRGNASFRIGELISHEQIASLPVVNTEKVNLVRQHLYRLGERSKPVFLTERSIIHPVDRQQIKEELKLAECLGETFDGKRVLLFNYCVDSAVIDEIGRLREETFRAVGEGTGKKKDIDQFDQHYRHLILWDEERLEIAGAYRLGESWRWGQSIQSELYCSTLFNWSREMPRVWAEGLELGRSFVQPQFWGKRSLDYLWQGIGAYVRRHPKVRYLFGPVSLSRSLPKRAQDMLVWHYSQHYSDAEKLATSRTPYLIDKSTQKSLSELMPGENRESDFSTLRNQLEFIGVRVPTLYKQYADAFEEGGLRFSAFNVDPNFKNCVDGLVIGDLHKLTKKKRERYLHSVLSHCPD